jgi:Malate/L-lactate dehydrogenase
MKCSPFSPSATPFNSIASRRTISTTSTRRSAHDEDQLSQPISLTEIRRFMIDSMTKVGTSEPHAADLADVLIAADYRGHFSHGLNRLGTPHV